MQDIFLKLNPDNLHELHNDLQFLSEIKKIQLTCKIKDNILYK